MNYSDGSPSFPSAAINPTRQVQFRPNVDYQMPPDDINNQQPPSQGSLGGYGNWNSQNQYQGSTGYRGFMGQPDDFDDREKSPSLTDMGRANVSNQFPTGQRSLGYSGGYGYGNYADPAPDFDDMARGNISNPSGGGVGLFTGENKAPTISDVGQRDNSQTGGASTINQISPEDQAFVGMSLVGKNFKRFYPNAYYKEKDEN